MKKIQHIIELLIVKFLFFTFRILSFNRASDFGFFLLRNIGPRTKFAERAKRNIKLAFPKISEEEISNIILGMWENLGRSIGEFPNIFNLSADEYAKYVKVNNFEHISKLENGGLIFSGHLGNWELIPYIFRNHPKKISIVYREANNKYVDKIINDYRNINNFEFIPKGKKGAKVIIRELKAKNIIIMLVDQRMRDGVKIPFFNQPALTAPAIASLALQYKIPIIPMHIERTKNNLRHKFEIFIDKPLQLELTGNKLEDIKKILLQVNKTLEVWVSKNPSQWFWIHDRWAKNKTH